MEDKYIGVPKEFWQTINFLSHCSKERLITA